MLAALRDGLEFVMAAGLASVLLLADGAAAKAAEPQDLDDGVVKLVVKYGKADDRGQTQEGHRVGSGFIVRCDAERAYIVTAYHVVKDSQETGVIFNAQRHATPLKPDVIDQQYWDERGLALLSVPADAARTAGARALPLSAGGYPGKGQRLLMIGNPRILGDWSWLRGDVASRKGEIFRVQVPVQEGNSGGPMLLDGQVVGIVLNDLQAIAEAKSVINIRNYLEGFGVTAQDGSCPGSAAQPGGTGASEARQPASTAEPVVAAARLTVRSNVMNDTVFIDGERHGPTRLDVELPAGSHLVRVEKEGHEPFEERVELAAGDEKVLWAKLEPIGPKPGETFRDCPTCPEMMVIPAGSFRMGSPEAEDGRDSDEGPVHTVRISEPFALGKREVTVSEFRAFVQATGYRTDAEKGGGCAVWDGSSTKWTSDAQRNWRSPGFSQGDDHPVVCVSWKDAREYLMWLSEEAKLSYRLPSEAEWEYAARAGTTTPRFWGERAQEACAYANVADEAAKRQFPDWTIHDCDDGFAYTAPVGNYKANAFGLLDILGNVWEWAEDCYKDSYTDAPSDGSAWRKGDCGRRLLRGGSWGDAPGSVRSAVRGSYFTEVQGSGVGFRPARTL